MSKKYAKTAFIFALILSPAQGLAGERHRLVLAHDLDNVWTGYGDLTTDAAGNVRGELCMVRREYVNQAVLPRTLVRVPVSGRRDGERLELNFPRVPDGPVAVNDAIALDHADDVGEDWEGGEGWRFGQRPGSSDENGQPIAAPRSDTIRHLELWPDPEPAPNARAGNFMTAATRDDHVIVAPRPESSNSTYSAINLAVYDAFSREQAIAFESTQSFEMLYAPGYVLAIAESGNLARLQAALDALGDGARIINLELRDCVQGRVRVVIVVPPLLEFWYVRQLQKGGLVTGAYPEGLPRDPGWTDPFFVRNASVVAGFRNPVVPMAQKYERLWTLFSTFLDRFAANRRPGFGARGSITRRRAGPAWMYMAEITGPALALCQTNRWERITIQASVNSAASVDSIAVSIQMSEGFFALGPNPPSEERWRDNRIPDGDLARLQELLVGAIENPRTSGVRCPR